MWETTWKLLVLVLLRLTECLALEKSTVVANLLHLAGAQITKSGRLNLKRPKTRALGNYQFCRNDVKLVAISHTARYVIKHQVQRSIGEMELGSIRCKHNVTWRLLSWMKDRLIGFKKTLFRVVENNSRAITGTSSDICQNYNETTQTKFQSSYQQECLKGQRLQRL